MLHVEHNKKREAFGLSFFVNIISIYLAYLPNFISITLISAGLTPGMRDA